MVRLEPLYEVKKILTMLILRKQQKGDCKNMGELNQAIEKIGELLEEEKRLMQRRERIKDEIRGHSLKVEKKLTHKKIVLGAALLAELLSSTHSSYADYKDYMCAIDDKILEQLGKSCARLLDFQADDIASLVDAINRKASKTSNGGGLNPITHQ